MTRHLRYIVFLLLLMVVSILCCNITLSAQSYKVRIKIIGTEQGLYDRQINDLFQDSFGFIWAVGNYKVYRFDGYYMADFTNYIKNQSPFDYFIISQTKMLDQYLYFNIPSGIVKFNPSNLQSNILYSSNTDSIETNIVDSFWDELDQCWILSDNGTVRVVDRRGNLIKRINLEGQKKVRSKTLLILNINEGRIGLVYKSISYKVFDLNGQFIKEAKFNRRIQTRDLPRIFIEKKDRNPKKITFQFKANDFITYKLNSDTLKAIGYWTTVKDTLISTYYSISPGFRIEERIDFLLKDARDSIILNISAEIRKVLRGKFSVLSRIITTDNVLWISVGYCIVQVSFDPQIFNNYLNRDITNENLVGNSLRGMYEDEFGKIWVASYGLDSAKEKTIHSIDLLRKKVLNYSTSSSRIGSELFYRIRKDSGSRILAMTEYGNICSIDLSNLNNGYVMYSFDLNGIKISSFDVYRTKNRDILVATSEGIYVLKRNGKSYTGQLLKGPGRYHYNAFKEAKDGNIYASGAGGLILLDGGNYSVLKKYNNISDSEVKIPPLFIQDLLEDGKVIWCATKEGLLKIDLENKGYTVYDKRDGLPDNYLYSVLEGEEDEIWMSSNNGIAVFNKASKTFRTFGFEHGLPALEFNNASFLKTRSGKLCFGGVNGLTLIDPALGKVVKKNDVKFGLEYCTFRKLNENKFDTLFSFDVPENLYFNPGMNNVSFTFYCSSYINTEQNRFRYRMINSSDTSWQMITNKNTVLFNYLPAGSYALEAQVAVAGLGWSSKSFQLPFEVGKYWYNTWYFYIGSFLLLGSLLYLLYSWRVNQMKKLQILRSRISSDIHDDIGSTLSSITLYSQTLLMTDPKAAQLPILEKIKRNAQLVQESLSDIIWSIRPSMDSMESIILRMRSYGVEYTEDAKITFELFCDDEINSIRLDMEARKNFYLIFKEAVNNAIKYSKTNKIYVSISMGGNHLVKMSIRDDGVGFDTSCEEAGNGLINMKRRSLDIGGNLEVLSTIGIGTEVILTFYSQN